MPSSWPSDAQTRAIREAVARQDDVLRQARQASRGTRAGRDVGAVARSIAKQLEGVRAKFDEAGITAGMSPAAVKRLQTAFAASGIPPAEFDRISRTLDRFYRSQVIQQRLERAEALAAVQNSVDQAFRRGVFATPRLAEALSSATVSAEAVADVNTGFEEVIQPALGEEAPDGMAGIPFMLGQLSSERRRELLLSTATLLVATVLYIRALAINAEQFETAAAGLLASAWWYASLVNALDDAERALQDEAD